MGLDADCMTNKDFFTMLFVMKMDQLMGVPGKHDWWTMSEEEKEKWRKRQEEFDWGDFGEYAED